MALIAEIRMSLAQALAGLALSIAPKDHPEARIMARHWHAWLTETQQNMERQHSFLRHRSR